MDRLPEQTTGILYFTLPRGGVQFSSHQCISKPYGFHGKCTTQTGNTEGTNDAVIHDDPYNAELQQLVFAQLDQAEPDKTGADTSVSSKWQRAYEVSGVLDILRTVSATVRHPTVQHTLSTFTAHPVGFGSSDPLSESLLSEVKAHLLEMRGLHSQWSNQSDPSVTRTLSNRSLVTMHRSTTREVIKLSTPPPDQKRVPFTLEESLALWQGFLEHRDAVDCWVRVWRQSFRRSGRRPVDLKDRWRVIQRSATLNRTIAEAYERWKSEKECNNRVPTLIITNLQVRNTLRKETAWILMALVHAIHWRFRYDGDEYLTSLNFDGNQDLFMSLGRGGPL
ncbi:hypothetical protein X801_05358, partial [Opisthorchis viverrini]